MFNSQCAGIQLLTKTPKRIIASFQNAEKPKTTDNEIIIRTEPFQIMFLGEQLLRYIRKAGNVINERRPMSVDISLHQTSYSA